MLNDAEGGSNSQAGYPDAVRRNRAAAMSELLLRMCGTPTIDAVCERCVYRAESWRGGGHCYMFRDRPIACGQFRDTSR